WYAARDVSGYIDWTPNHGVSDPDIARDCVPARTGGVAHAMVWLLVVSVADLALSRRPPPWRSRSSRVSYELRGDRPPRMQAWRCARRRQCLVAPLRPRIPRGCGH